MSGGLPKAVKLKGGAVEFVPQKTIILNPRIEGQASCFYFVWANYGEGEHVSELNDAITDESVSLFGWFSDDALFLQHVYEQTDEVQRCVIATLDALKPQKGAFINISFMRSEFMSAGKGLVAGIEIGLK